MTSTLQLLTTSTSPFHGNGVRMEQGALVEFEVLVYAALRLSGSWRRTAAASARYFFSMS